LHDDIFSGIKAVLGIGQPAGQPAAAWVRFQDPVGNFVIRYPSGWKFDRDIAVMEGAYTISFSSSDGRCTFNIAVDAGLKGGPKTRGGFDFPAYAKAALESPSSGIYTPVKKSEFRGMPAFRRDYTYHSSGRTYSAGGVMFFTGRAVFSISWNAPEREKNKFDALYQRMLESLIILPGLMRQS
jgi:hypothetical protein